jgi:hypothetical protein
MTPEILAIPLAVALLLLHRIHRRRIRLEQWKRAIG